MKKVYNEKIIRKKILRAWKHTKEDLIGRETTQMPEHKITFKIIYYPAFQNVRGIMEELNLLLISNQKHKKAFPNVPVIGSCHGKSVKDSLVRATLPILNDNGRCEACGEKKTFLYVCGEFPYVGKAETKFGYRFTNYESKHGAFRLKIGIL